MTDLRKAALDEERNVVNRQNVYVSDIIGAFGIPREHWDKVQHYANYLNEYKVEAAAHPQQCNQDRAQTSAERTLRGLGYTDHGGEYWKPPLVEQCKREVWRWYDLSLHDLKSAIEAKLKEKNNV